MRYACELCGSEDCIPVVVTGVGAARMCVQCNRAWNEYGATVLANVMAEFRVVVAQLQQATYGISATVGIEWAARRIVELEAQMHEEWRRWLEEYKG